MRNVSANELHTIGELRHTMTGDEASQLKSKAAYEVYDQLGNMFTTGDWGDMGEGLWEYTKATLTAPSTYLGGIVGRVGVKAATTAAQKAAVQAAARAAFRTGGKEAAKQVIAGAAKSRALATIAAAAVADGTMNTAQDYLYQSNMMEVGAQDEYSILQGGVSALGGLAGGAVAAIPEFIGRGATSTILRGSDKSIKADTKAATNTAIKKALPRIRKSVQKMADQSKEWMKAVADGKAAVDMPLGELSKIHKWFMDPREPESIVNILVESGMRKWDSEGNVTEQLGNFARNLPEESRKEIDDALVPLGVNLGEMVDITSRYMNETGRSFNLNSQVAKVMKEVGALSAAKKANNKAIVEGTEALGEEGSATADLPSPQVAKYVASLWRRLLVSHPATTMVNVVGWGQSYGARSLAEVLHGGVLGTSGFVGKMLGREWGDKNLLKARNLMGHQIFKARTLLDPYSSREGYENLIKELGSKKQQEALFRESFGGVGQMDNPSAYNIPESKLVKGAEAYSDVAARLTLVKAQDVYTKSLSGIVGLDLAVRKGTGRSLTDVLASGDSHLITKEMMEDSIHTALKDTFSVDYTRGTGDINEKETFNYIADIVERMSNAPYLGFLFPFGRFMNNNLAFIIEYSPLSVMGMATKLPTKSGRQKLAKLGADEIQERVARATVGTVGLATLIAWSAKQEEQGMQWNEIERGDGTIINAQNMAPVSVYMNAARIGHLLNKGEGVPPELFTELGVQLGPGNMLRAVDQDNPINDVITALTEASTPEEQKGYIDLLKGMVRGLAGNVVSGFTRPMDVPNTMVGEVLEQEGIAGTQNIDRRQAESFLDGLQVELLRYTDHIFAPFIGETAKGEELPTVGTPARSATRPEGNIYQPNAVGAMYGMKEVGKKNSINKLLGMVNLPEWTFDQRTSQPAFDRWMNERVAPILDQKAERLLASKVFQNSTRDVQLAQAKALLVDTRDEIRKGIEGGDLGGPEARTLNARRRWAALPSADRNDARRALNITTPDNKLSMGELERMRSYIEELQEFHKRNRQ